MPTLMKCPACPTMLQPLDASTDYVAQAMAIAQERQVDVPAHGPAVLVWAAFVVHHHVVHSQLELKLYLEAARL